LLPVEDSDILALFAVPATREAAFAHLMRKYQSRLYWHVRKMVVGHDDADDLLQEIFVKVWRALPNFRQDAQLFTWLYRIATNECLGFLSSKKRKILLPMTDAGEELAAKLEADEMPGAEAIEHTLQLAILALPDKQRLVFNLRYYDEMPYEEMAAVTGTSVGALKASYHHAAKKIEEFMTRRD
jgi:RNA polymerase sigma factor (sigma-70 family)